MSRTVWTRKTWGFRSPLDPWAVPGEICPEDPGSNFLFLYAEHKYLEAASSSFWSHHTTTLTGLSAQCSLQCISHTQCKSSRAICQCGDGQGGEEMPLWCVYLMCLFKCALSPQMLVEWPRCHQAWAPCFCVGSRSVFFLPHVPISNLIKENIEIKLFPPSFLTS